MSKNDQPNDQGNGEQGSLEDLLTDAERQAEQFSTARARLLELKEDLRARANDLYQDEQISGEDFDDLIELIDEGEYGEVRERLDEARNPLEFDDDEKDRFAAAFGESWDVLEASVEQIRSALLELDRDVDREDMVSLLYGKYSGLRKKDIRRTFEAIDEIETTSIDAGTMARVLSAIEPELNITPARDVIEAIQAEKDDEGGD